MKFNWKDKNYKRLQALKTWKLKKIRGCQQWDITLHDGSFDMDIDDDLLVALDGVPESIVQADFNITWPTDQPRHAFSQTLVFLHRKLKEFDCRKLEHFRITHLPKQEWSYNIKNPQRISKGRRYWKHFYKIRMGINSRMKYPHAEKIAIGSYKTDTDWGYEEQLVEFRTIDELLIFVAGSVTYRFVKHDKQIDEGRLGNPSANRYGLKWLKEFTGRDPMIVRGKHYHSIDDDFWSQKG